MIEKGEHWHGWIERASGFLGSVFGGRRRHIDQNALAAIDQILRNASEVADVTWEEP